MLSYVEIKNSIHLQGIGRCAAIPAQEIKVGMLISWNCSPNGHAVESIKEVSEHFIEIVEKDRNTQVISTRRLRKDRLVAAEFCK